MRKFLSLLALMLLCSIGASAAFTPSTLADPVKYTLVNKNSMGITSRLTYLGYDPEDAGAGLFIFIEQSGTNRYKIYETTSKKYIGLVGGASTQGKSYTRLVADEADAEVFTITPANTTYNLISPTSLGTTYLNFHGGADQNKSGQTIGFWTDGASDNGSCWQFIEYSLTWKKPQFGGTVWTYNTSTNQFDADGKTSTAAPERSDNKGPVYKFENVGTVSSPVGDVNTSDFGGIRVLGNGDNVTSKLGNWAGSIEVEKFAIANVTYGIDLKGREPANSATVWVDGELNFGTARTSFSMNDGTNGETQGQRWYIGENGVIKSAFTSVNRGTRTWDLQVVVADEPEQAGYKRVQKTISKKVMTWGADISSNISSITAWYKDAEGNYAELPQSAVTYDATGITITYDGYGNFSPYSVNFTNEAHKHTHDGVTTTDTRVVTQLKLGEQTVDVDGTGNFYQNLYESKTFTITAGESVKPQIIWNGSWMAGYVYVEATPDCGSFTVEDLKSNTAGEGTHNFTTDLPAFTINDPGTYHMRYKVDWNSTDPGGSSSIKTDGGYIIDVKLIVEAPEEPSHYLVPNGVYEIKNVSNEGNGVGRGYLVDYTGYANGPSIAECNWSDYTPNHPSLHNQPGVTCGYWYVYNNSDGSVYMYSLSTLNDNASPKFLNVSETASWLTTPSQKLEISASTYSNPTATPAFSIRNLGGADNEYLSMACGSNSTSGAIKRNSMTDGGNPLQFISVNVNTLTEAQRNVMDYGIRMIEGRVNAEITYEVYFNGAKLYEEVKTQEIGSDYAYALPEAEKRDYLDVTVETGTVSAAATVRVDVAYNSNLPFQVGEKYRIKLKDTFAHSSGTAFPLTNAEGFTDDYVFTVGGDWYNGFTLFNEGAQKYLSYGTNVNPSDDTHASPSENVNAGAKLDLLRKEGYNYFRIHGSTNNSFANSRSSSGTNYFSTWQTNLAYGNDGSRVFFILDSNIDVVYNITATDAEGNNPIHITRSETETRGQMPVVDAFDYFSDFVVTDAVAVDRDHTTFNVTAKYAYPMMPGHLYQIKQGSTFVQYVDDNNVSIKKTSDATNDKNLWYVLINDNGTFKLCNAYKGLALGATKDGTNACNFKTIAEQGDNFEFVKYGDSFGIFWPNNNEFNLGSHGNPGDGANKGLGRWNTGRAQGTLFIAEEVELAAIKLTNPNPSGTSGLNGKYVGTFSSVYNVALPEGVVAYTGEIAENGKLVNFTEIGQTVPANTGVLLYAADASTSITANAAVATEPVLPTIENNVFEHTAAESKPLDEGSLVLGKGNNGVGFYKITPDKNVVARYKAYIPASAATSIARYAFDFEDSTLTEIEAIDASPAAGNVFDLQGRRVQNAQKGLYIINGKKVVR